MASLEHMAAWVAAAFLAGGFLWLSATWYRRQLAELRRTGGKFKTEAFSLADAMVAMLLALWLLANALPAFGLGVSPQSSAEAAASASVSREVILFSIFYFGGIVVLLTAFLAVRGHSFVSVMGLGKTSARHALGLGVIGLLAVYPLLGLAAALGSLIPGEFAEAQQIVLFFLNSDSFGDRLLVILMAVVVAPVTEEIVFRGYLYGAAKKHLGPIAASLSTAMLFALIHAHIPSLGVFFLLSLTLNLVVERTGSLLPAMATHALFNFVSLSVILLFVET